MKKIYQVYASVAIYPAQLKTKLRKGIQNNSQLRFHQGCFKREIQVAEKTQEFQH